jgi:hypothetical protein
VPVILDKIVGLFSDESIQDLKDIERVERSQRTINEMIVEEIDGKRICC